MSKKWKELDPQAQQEKHNYNSPIPSRLYLIQLLQTFKKDISHSDLCNKLNLKASEHKKALLLRLNAMSRDKQIFLTKKGDFKIIKNLQLIEGKVQSNKDGYGFLIPDHEHPDLYLAWKDMRSLFDQDKAIFQVLKSKDRGFSGKLIAITKRSISQCIGKYIQHKDFAEVIPENPKITHKIKVKKGAIKAKNNDYVLIEIISYPSYKKDAIGIIKKKLGDTQNIGIEIDLAIDTYQLRTSWPKNVTMQEKKIPTEVKEKDKKNRADLRNLPFVTIDGNDAKDFDDAVFCTTKKSGGWRLYVAIADVSFYVNPNDPIDLEAKLRSTSVYFPTSVIPMIPEILSNGLCSLNEKVDRLAIVCEMTISENARLSGFKFYEAVIQSHARLTYDQVDTMLEDSNSKLGEKLNKKYQHLLTSLTALLNIHQVLNNNRLIKGSLSIDTIETQMLFNKNGKIDKIVPINRNIAHKIIEECMLIANICAAKFLEKQDLSVLYRIHESPPQEKKKNLENFLKTIAIDLPKGKLKPIDYQNLLKSTADRPDFQIIQSFILRSMNQAIYTTKNIGHFGLAFKEYTHFTSPIRRFPDLMVHRAIRSIIRSNSENKNIKRFGAKLISQDKIYPYSDSEIEQIAEDCSLNERNAESASRDAENWLKCHYMQNFIGQSFTGMITTVLNFGFFVTIDNIFIDGLIHINDLNDDRYSFSTSTQCLLGKSSGKKYQAGQVLTVYVSNVDIKNKRINLTINNNVSKRKTKSKKNKKY